MGAIITQNFNGCSLAAAEQAKPSVSVMSVLAPNVNLNQNVKAPDAIKPDAKNGAALAQEAKVGLAACQKDVKSALAGGVAAMKERRAEINAAEVANKMNVGEVAPAQPMAPNSEMALALGAVGQLATGKGSAGMVANKLFGASEYTSTAEDIMGGMKGKPLQEKIDLCQATLTQSSPQNWVQQEAMIIEDANKTPVLDNATGADWEMACAIDEDIITKVAGFSEDNLSAFPELQALADLDAQIDLQMGELTAVEMQSNEMASIEIRKEKEEGFGHSSRIDAADLKGVSVVAANLAAAPTSFSDNVKWDAARSIASLLIEEDSLDKPPALDREAELEELGIKAANWGAKPSPESLYA